LATTTKTGAAITLTIDDQVVTAHEGETILRCALRHDIFIPHLCTHPTLPDFGACRMCLVEVEGLRGRAAACTTPAADGMVVHTNSPSLRKLRKSILELLLLEHPSSCIVCGEQELCEKYRPQPQKAGRTTGCHTCNNKDACELRDLCNELGITQLPAAPFYRDLSIERWDPFIDRDLNLCILCGRCVRICKQHHTTATIDFIGRGSSARIGEAFGRTLAEAGCHFCGSCVDVCPTGSLAERYAKWHRRPNELTETTCTLCPEACPVGVASENGRAFSVRTARPDMAICVLGRFAIPAFLNAPERLRAVRRRVGKVLREVSWEEAMEAAAEKLKAFTGDAFACVCDTTCSLEDRNMLARFAAEVMQSKHFIEIEPDDRGRSQAALPAGVKALYMTGAFVSRKELRGIELLLLQDCHATEVSEGADFVFPAAALLEVEGSCIDEGGTRRPLIRCCQPAGEALADWEITCRLAQAMGAEGFAFGSASEITAVAGMGNCVLRMDRTSAPPAAQNPGLRRTHYRGHEIAEKVPGLRDLPLTEEVPS
jgi:NADH dehydrogenase/NADH:ubiquinone oxidoreductase subunit G